jgi:outer membrane protein assembly factor BamA
MRALLGLLVVPCLVLSSVLAFAQDTVAVQTVAFAGADNFSQQDLAAAASISPGSLTQDQIQKAADTLAASGQFEKVDFSVDKGTLTYQLTPAPHPLPVHFENVVWWPDLDILREVHQKVPLFMGLIGGKGTVQAQVQQALLDLAREKAGKDVTVAASTVAIPPSGKTARTSAIGFSITAPPIMVDRVIFSNNSLEMSAVVADVARALEGKPYNRDVMRAYLASQLATAFADKGYIDFSLKDFHPSDPTHSVAGYTVNIEAQVDPGPQYHVASVNWTPSPQLSADAFNSLASIKTGDVAALPPLEDTLHAIERAYEHQGYVSAHAAAKPVLDKDHSTVSYEIIVDAGGIFHTD